jgi:hypothetical protein
VFHESDYVAPMRAAMQRMMGYAWSLNGMEKVLAKVLATRVLSSRVWEAG